MTRPTPPTGVVVHTETGDHPADLTYTGVRKDGLHVWHADALVPVGEVIRITVAELPPKTLVMFPVGAGR